MALHIFVLLALSVLPASAKTVVTTGDDGCGFVITLNKGFAIFNSREIDKKIDQIKRRNKYLDGFVHPGTVTDILNNMREFYGGADITQEQTDALAETERNNKLIDGLEHDKAQFPELERKAKKNYQDKINEWKNQIENFWNGAGVKFGCCKVKFAVNVVFKDNPDDIPDGYDKINIHLDPEYRSDISGFKQGSFKDGFSHDPYDHDMGGNWAIDDPDVFAPHEAGHEMGLEDQYKDYKNAAGRTCSKANEGHEGDIMATLKGKVVSQQPGKGEINNVYSILNNLGLKCPEKCCPHCTTGNEGSSSCVSTITNLVSKGVQAYHTVKKVGEVISTAKDMITGTTAHAPTDTATGGNPGYTAQNHCDIGNEGTCSPNPCPDDQQCKMVSKKSNGASYDCYLCNEKPKTDTGVPPTNTAQVTTGYTPQNHCDVGDEGGCSPNPCYGQECSMISQKSKGASYDCHLCKGKPKFDCASQGFSGDSSCDGKCTSDETCSYVIVSTIGGGGTCFRCDAKPKTAVNPLNCSTLDMSDDPTCGGKCTDGATCESMNVDLTTGKLLADGQTTTNPAKACYTCRTHSIVAPQPVCSKYGYSNDSSCGGKCSADDCVSEYIDPSSGTHVPWYRSYGTSAVRCYYCAPNYDEELNTCHAHDMYYYDDCGEDCPPDECEEYYVSRSSGKEVHPPVNFKDVYICYDCMPFDHYLVYVRHNYYVITVVETPFGRYVLNHTSADPNVFAPSSVMALAKVDKTTDKVPDVSGNMQAVSSLVGGFSTGFGPSGIATTGQVSMDQLSDALQNSLKSGGDYGANCFDKVKDQADQQAAQAGTATSKNISDGKMNNQDRGSSEKAYSPDQIKASGDAGTPAVSGPMIACGTQNGNKVLEVLDGSGNLVGSITQVMLKSDPNIILKKLATAQGWTDKLNQKIKMQASQLPEKISGQNDHQGETIPNDPLYPKPKAEKKKGGLFSSLFGLGDNTNVPINADGAMQSQTLDMVNNGDGVSDQYYLPIIGYTPLNDPNSAWNAVDATQKNVLVAIVDSGLDMSHPDRPEHIWTDPQRGNHGWNFVNENADLTDYRGHGTFVAGIIAAKWNNGIGIAGINPGAVIMPVKVTDDKGKTNSLLIYRGINYALDHGARIINVSLGGVTISKLEQVAIARAHAMGALVVIAAGNTSDDLMNFGPSSSKYALSVGMVDIGGARSLVSSWGANLGLMGPGEKIISLCSKDAKDVLPSIKKYGYYKESGTSFTAPMVTATASLILAKDPQLTGEQIADIIEKTAQPISHNDWDGQTGFGLLNASTALRATVDDHLLVMITNMHYNRDRRDRLTSLDIYGTVKGTYKEMTIEAGRGKNALGFRKIAGPFSGAYDNQLIARLVIQDVLRGSDEWVLRLKVIDDQGKEHIASTSFKFPDK